MTNEERNEIWLAKIKVRDYLPPEFPTIVCLCGSTRFGDAFKDALRTETLAGRIVLSVGLLGHAEGIDMDGPVKVMLDELHCRKIDMSDEVLILNVLQPACSECGAWFRWAPDDDLNPIRVPTCNCGLQPEGAHAVQVPYIGASTERELAYARKRGKVIRFLNPESEVTS